ncbi:MAG: hypothetical protein JWO20_2478 [Candidatus Angelobacter sp.]|jgi:hypothetical protein|nr:hypothetical protein [Candidatus Angelobacter sp.]
MTLELHVKIVGALLVMLGLAHATFNKRFEWDRELARLSLLNRQMFLVHAFFIALTLVMMGSVSLFYTAALLQPTPLSRIVLTGVAIFWVCRLFIQFLVYDSALWRGNRFHTLMHVVFSCFWIYVVCTYALAARHVWN